LVLLATADILIAQVQDLAKPIWTASLKIQGYHHYSARAATRTLSPSAFPLGEQVKELKIELEYDQEKPKPQCDYLLLSPSGGTILDVNKWEGGQTYRIVDTDSLSVRREWIEKQHGRPLRWASYAARKYVDALVGPYNEYVACWRLLLSLFGPRNHPPPLPESK
jgi:hypothetical protein